MSTVHHHYHTCRGRGQSGREGAQVKRLQVKPLRSSQNGLSPADYPLPRAQTPGGQTLGDVDSDMAVSHGLGHGSQSRTRTWQSVTRGVASSIEGTVEPGQSGSEQSHGGCHSVITGSIEKLC
jgi:hypothetical protein